MSNPVFTALVPAMMHEDHGDHSSQSHSTTTTSSTNSNSNSHDNSHDN